MSATNQAALVPSTRFIEHDGYRFNTHTEIKVYEGLKRAQADAREITS